MPTISRFEEMETWQTGRLLARRIYALTSTGAWSRDFGLRDQVRRSAVSIMSNIAEGFECGGDAQFARYLTYAKGSAGELRAQLYVALDAGYLDEPSFGELVSLAERCSRQLSRLLTYLQRPGGGRRIADGVVGYDDDEPSDD
jgi:four helix bundle protein